MDYSQVSLVDISKTARDPDRRKRNAARGVAAGGLAAYGGLGAATVAPYLRSAQSVGIDVANSSLGDAKRYAAERKAGNVAHAGQLKALKVGRRAALATAVGGAGVGAYYSSRLKRKRKRRG